MPGLDSTKRNMFMTSLSRDQRKCLAGTTANIITAYKTKQTNVFTGGMVIPPIVIRDYELSIPLEANVYYQLRGVIHNIDDLSGMVFTLRGGDDTDKISFFQGIARFVGGVGPTEDLFYVTNINDNISNADAGLLEFNITCLSLIPITLVGTYSTVVATTIQPLMILPGSNIIATPLDNINNQ